MPRTPRAATDGTQGGNGRGRRSALDALNQRGTRDDARAQTRTRARARTHVCTLCPWVRAPGLKSPSWTWPCPSWPTWRRLSSGGRKGDVTTVIRVRQFSPDRVRWQVWDAAKPPMASSDGAPCGGWAVTFTLAGPVCMQVSASGQKFKPTCSSPVLDSSSGPAVAWPTRLRTKLGPGQSPCGEAPCQRN